ncbi:biotin/lipoyl-containing protein [Desulfolucanica intricata]|uniref:biotin/lipoyl-containing protein n=1 Tax=Desulfolucanica intricata TaxID=1285191 RepID=UPI0008352705|nr:biotin/lipoyl-containing protein [Desulfolucanica intricata]
MEIKLPFLAEGVETAKVSFWHLDEGDTIKEGEDLVEISTSKAVFNVPAPVSGKIVEVIVGEGDEIKVGETLAIIEKE